MAAASPPLREFTFAELHAATEGFSDLLGEGGFGKVYRGRMVLPVADYVTGGTEMREREVAVKVTKGKQFTNKELKDFQAEVAAMMSAMNHPNILRLEGMAIDSEQRPVLVHELIPGGDVKNLLQRVGKNEARFSWKDRMKVALGCAEALAFFHENMFIHRNFKSSKVFLRQDFTPVVAVVGLACGIKDRETPESRTVVGTLGYIDPNYFKTEKACQKADTYAFGVFLLELIFGYYPMDERYHKLKMLVSHRDFTDPSLVTDPTIEGEWKKEHILQIIVMALFAINPIPTKRPPISDIAAKLRGIRSEM